MRLLVLDQSRILPWLIRHELPAEIEVDAVFSLSEAVRLVLDGAPDAAVVSLPPAHLPWRAFQYLCANRRPPVPVLYESCLFAGPREAGLEPGDGWVEFLPKPAARSALRAALGRLLAAAEGARSPQPAAHA